MPLGGLSSWKAGQSNLLGTFEVVEPSEVRRSPNPKIGSGDHREMGGQWKRNQPTEKHHGARHRKEGRSLRGLKAFEQQATETTFVRIACIEGSTSRGFIGTGLVRNRAGRSFETLVGYVDHGSQKREDHGKKSDPQASKEAAAPACGPPSRGRGSSDLLNHRTNSDTWCAFLPDPKAFQQTASLSIDICTGFRCPWAPLIVEGQGRCQAPLGRSTPAKCRGSIPMAV
mgnify:CR=1 FL=1